jgi:tetratricopeptide (TPR) repeat protein
VAAICHRLDGLPLAIELAAARIKLFSPEALLPRLESRLKLLTGGARDLPERQQTLRDTIGWSYDLLSEAERTLFRRLSVFAGGWTLEAAEAVCMNDEGDSMGSLHPSSFILRPSHVLDLLCHLVDKSLVLAEVGGDGSLRYRLLETLRQYGQERLAQCKHAAATQRRHAAYYLALVEEAEPHLSRPEQAAWLDRLEREYDNLRVALRWCVKQAEAEMGLRLAGALWRFWFSRGHLDEGREWLTQLLALPVSAECPAARAKALNGAGILAHYLGDYPAAQALHAESLAIRRELGDQQGIAMSLSNLGLVLRCRGDYAAACTLYEQALAAARALGDRTWEALILNNLGRAAYYQGLHGVARTLHDAGLALAREVGDKWSIAATLNNLADLAQAQGDAAAARVLHEQSLQLFQALGDRWGIAQCLEGLGSLAAAQAEPERMVRLLGAAAALREAIGAPCSPARQSRLQRLLEAARQALSGRGYIAAWTEGRATPLERAIADALALRVAAPAGLTAYVSSASTSSGGTSAGCPDGPRSIAG